MELFGHHLPESNNGAVTERVFGPQRRQLFLADLDEVDDTARQERVAQRQRLQRKLGDTVRKHDNVLRQAEDADPNDPFTHGLRQRFNDLETERQARAGHHRGVGAAGHPGAEPA